MLYHKVKEMRMEKTDPEMPTWRQKLRRLERSRMMATGKRGLFSIIFGRSTVLMLLLVLQLFLLFGTFLRWNEYFPYYFGSATALAAVMAAVILNSRADPTVKASWCALIAVAPVFGAALYWYFQLDIGHRLNRAVLRQSERDSLAHTADQSALMQKLEAENKPLHDLAAYTENAGGYQLFGNTDVTYFKVGEEKFAAMLEQLEKAERYIFLEYFSIGQGQMWSRILDVLLRKADAGVEVRILYDGNCAVLNLPYGYPTMLARQGIRCKVYSPPKPLLSTYYNNRDHRKILVIDGHTAFTGGVNLEDRYVNIGSPYGHWKDAAIMVKGDAARGFAHLFLQMWNAGEKQPAYAPYLPAPGSVPQPVGQGYVLPFGFSPLNDDRTGEMIYLDILNRAEQYVYIMTPYLILDGQMTTALTFAARRGVDVRILLPHVPDKKYAFVLAKRHYKELADAGVKLYEYTPGFVHSKVFVSDDKKAVVGTINLDYRSLYLNFECAAYLYDVPAVGDIKADFLQTLQVSQQVSAEEIRNPGWRTRLAGWLLKIIAPLM